MVGLLGRLSGGVQFFISEGFMLCPVDDLLLMILVQIDKVVTIAGHAYEQVAVGVWIRLGLAKRLRIHDVELNMVPV